MSDSLYRVLALATHPVQYAAPIFRRLADCAELDFQVAYCGLQGAETGFDSEFGVAIQWDVPLLDGYSWTHIPNRGSGTESFFGLYNPGLWKLIQDGHFDAIISYVGYLHASFWLAYFAALHSNTAFLFGTDASSLAPRSGLTWKSWIKRVVWPCLFSLADQVIAPSSATVRMLRELGIPDRRISLTPFVVDNDWWIERSSRTDRAAIRADWGASEADLVVLYCAKLQGWKRPLDLLRAFAKADIPNSILVYAGEGPLRPEIENEAAALGIGGRIRLLGFTNQSRLPAIYSSADLFVLPSDYDPCPVVVCEAMLCGLPVILSDKIAGRFDLVEAGITGDVYPCGDIDALASSLGKMLSDRTTLRVLAASARARIETWSPDRNVVATVEAVAAAVSHRTRRRVGGVAAPKSVGKRN
jgi:glycosyltransferase involved in cell wall biosynthesis